MSGSQTLDPPSRSSSLVTGKLYLYFSPTGSSLKVAMTQIAKPSEDDEAKMDILGANSEEGTENTA
jgi:hypothetical protein